MSTPHIPSPTGPTGTPAPPLPPGWEAHWSPEQNAWYYVFPTTGLTQWEFPGAQPSQPHNSDQWTPAPTPDQQSAVPSAQPPLPGPNEAQYFPPPDQSQYATAPNEAGPPMQDGERGLGTAALALGGGFLAGKAFSGHKFDGGSAGFGKMATSFAAGAIGTKMFGFLKNSKPQHQATPPPQPQPQPQMQPQVHVYPVYMSGPAPMGAPPQAQMPPQGLMTPPQGPPPGYQGYGQPLPTNTNFGYPPSTAPISPPPDTPHSSAGFQSPVVPLMSSTMPVTGPQLYIHGAAFADKNVTDIARSLVTSKQELTLTGETLVEKFGDPWPEVGRKMFSVLYSYGDRPMELLVACTNNTNIEIKNEAISKRRMDFCNPPPSRIAACVWGVENPLTAPRLEKLEKDGEMEGSMDGLGGGGFYGWEPKTLTCYYRTETGGIDIKFCREGGTIRLPWNPLAKWS